MTWFWLQNDFGWIGYIIYFWKSLFIPTCIVCPYHLCNLSRNAALEIKMVGNNKQMPGRYSQPKVSICLLLIWTVFANLYYSCLIVFCQFESAIKTASVDLLFCCYFFFLDKKFSILHNMESCH